MGTSPSAGTAGAGFGALIPLIIMMIPIILICYRLAKDKGKNVVKYTILSFIPLVNYFILAYLVGTPNLILDRKLDRILSLLEKKQPNENILEL